MPEITGKTKQLCIIGAPADHSFSPKMHNYISKAMNKDYVYTAFNVPPEKLEDAIKGVRAFSIAGLNVTAPHKKEVMQYLDEISPQAQTLGAVNTIVNRNGRLIGYNTDAEGFYMALDRAGIKISGSNMLVIGAGGVVKPTLMRLIHEDPSSVTLVNRTKDKACRLAAELLNETGYKINTEFHKDQFDIVINMTSAGMEPQTDALPIDSIDEIDSLDFINENTAAVDMIYNPDKTRFLCESEKRGAKILNGLDMLIYQGIIAYELFCDIKLPLDMCDRIARDVFGR